MPASESDPVGYGQSVQLGEAGLEALGESPANPGTSAIPPSSTTQNPTRATETDPLTAFVASLTPDQKAKLAALLIGGPGG